MSALVCTVSSSRLPHVIVRLDNAVRESLHRQQAERHLPMSRSYQRYAFADERRDEADDELIDRTFIEEGSDELAAAHHPQILSGLSAQPFREPTYRLRYETDADRDRWRWRLTREHVVHVICTEARAHLDTQVECLSAENLRVDRAHEFWQTIKTFRRRTIRQPVDVSVRSSDVTISARRDVNDDFSLRHGCPFLVVSRVKIMTRITGC